MYHKCSINKAFLKDSSIMSCNAYLKKKENTLVNDLLACTHKFFMVMCAFLNICEQINFVFEK